MMVVSGILAISFLIRNIMKVTMGFISANWILKHFNSKENVPSYGMAKRLEANGLKHLIYTTKMDGTICSLQRAEPLPIIAL